MRPKKVSHVPQNAKQPLDCSRGGAAEEGI
jgi:hypothetical protein